MLSDEALTEQIKQGSQEAMALLVERHHRLLFGFLYRMTGGDQLLAEDLIQETFLRMMRSIHSYQADRPFKSWLYRIATNLARDHFKRAETRRTNSLEAEFDLPAAQQVESQIINGEEEKRLSVALMSLPEHQREAVILRYYQELSLAEIAAALDIPIGTVKSRLSLGLGRLKMILEEA